MRYLSVCSGIEAASVAWEPLGWEAAGFAEIDRFPSEVLAHRYGSNMPGDPLSKNGIPNYGDFTTIGENDVGPVDLLVGGTPCQSFSIAGLRKGMDDDRGNLALEFLRLAGRIRPRWVVWENVPGVLSSASHAAPDPRPPEDPVDMGCDGAEMETEDEYDSEELHAFECFLAGLSECGYGWSYRVLDAQYVRVDSHPFAVPQRRRRVFVVGYLGDWRRAAAVLFEPESLRGDPAPRRKAGAVAAALSATGVGTCGADDNHAQGGHLIAPPLTGNPYGDHAGREELLVASTGDISHCLNAGGMGRQDFETETVIAHALRGEGFDASEDGSGRGTPIVPVAFHGSQDPDVSGDVTHPVGRNHGLETCIAFSAKDHGADALDGLSPTLRAGGHDASHANAGVMPAVAIQERAVSENPDARPDGKGFRDDGASYTLEARGVPQAVSTLAIRGRADGGNLEVRNDGTANAVLTPTGGRAGFGVGAVQVDMTVRRLTPRECERLQGFPDDWTMIPRNGKPADQCPDGPRYKAIGNSMAVNVMSWIGRRIDVAERASCSEAVGRENQASCSEAAGRGNQATSSEAIGQKDPSP